MYGYDPAGSHKRDQCAAAGAAASLTMPFLDNQVSFNKNTFQAWELEPRSQSRGPRSCCPEILTIDDSKFNWGCSKISKDGEYGKLPGNFSWAHLNAFLLSSPSRREATITARSAPCEKPKVGSKVPSNGRSVLSISATASKLSTNPLGGSRVSCGVYQAYASISSDRICR